MVCNPVLADGYPVPMRKERAWQEGLELSLGLMVALSHADWVTIFDHAILLKGTVSALVPVKQTNTSITWHFKINKGEMTLTSWNDSGDNATPLCPLLILRRSQPNDISTSLCRLWQTASSHAL